MSVVKNSNAGHPVYRRHSIFGDYLTGGDTKSLLSDELKEAQTEITNYNALWREYAKGIASKWGAGSFPTEKGFTEWLRKLTNRVSDDSKVTREER